MLQEKLGANEGLLLLVRPVHELVHLVGARRCIEFVEKFELVWPVFTVGAEVNPEGRYGLHGTHGGLGRSHGREGRAMHHDTR